MSDSENPDVAALAGLEEVIRHVSDELATWRRRALKAEGDRGFGGGGGPDQDVVSQKERLLGLEGQNSELERRLDAARGRVQDLIKRLRFLEEQVAVGQGQGR